MSPRVLLVDDEANIRKMVGALLQSEGFETAEAPNGAAALATVEREAPDADRKSTRLNSSHRTISYAVFCLKKKKKKNKKNDIVQHLLDFIIHVYKLLKLHHFLRIPHNK